MATEAWIQITVDDLSAYLADSAMVALREAALGAGQTDPFLEHMPTITAMVRAEIKSNVSNVLSATVNSVPRSLKNITCLLIIDAMQGRLPGVSLTDGQRKMMEWGMKLLERVASGDFKITLPPDPAENTSQTGPNAFVISSTRLTTTRCQTKGL